MFSSWFAQQLRQHMTGMNGIQMWFVQAHETVLTNLQTNVFLQINRVTFVLIVFSLNNRKLLWLAVLRLGRNCYIFPVFWTFCCLSSCSCGKMTSRKKVLLKVIILGDSGWVITLYNPVYILHVKTSIWRKNTKSTSFLKVVQCWGVEPPKCQDFSSNHWRL